MSILRHFISRAASLAEETSDPAGSATMLAPEVPNKASGGAPPAKRARGDNVGGVVVSVLSPLASVCEKNDVAGKGKKSGVGVDKTMKAKVKTKGNKRDDKTTPMDDDDDDAERDAGGGGGGGGHTNGNTVTTNAGLGLSNGHSAGHDDGGTSSDGGVSDGGAEARTRIREAKGGAGETAAKDKRRNKGDPREAALAKAMAAARAERGVRVALTLPHNEAFLRSALAGLSHGEVVIVLKVSGSGSGAYLALCCVAWVEVHGGVEQ